MAKITIVNESNKGLPATIFNLDDVVIGSANIDGQIELPNGRYYVKFSNYNDIGFVVNNRNFTYTMTPKTEVTSYEQRTPKRASYVKWLKIGAIGLVIFGIVKLITRK